MSSVASYTRGSHAHKTSRMASKIDHNHKHRNESGNSVATFIPMLMVMINFGSHFA